MPLNGVCESCIELTEPFDVTVVVMPHMADAAEPMRISLPSIEPSSCEMPMPSICRLPPVSCQPARLVIVEGSYSHHPALADCYDLRVFVTCSKAEQTRRLQAREGARYPAFAQRWIPLEEGYFAKYSIAESADLILDPEKGMIEATKS